MNRTSMSELHASLEQIGNTKAHRCRLNGVTLCFSYKTLIGFWYKGQGFKVCNLWGNTTGKHFGLHGLGNTKNKPSCDVQEYATEAELQHALANCMQDDWIESVLGQEAEGKLRVAA